MNNLQFRNVVVQIELNLSDLGDVSIHGGGHDFDQLFPTYVTGGRPQFPGHLQRTIATITENTT